MKKHFSWITALFIAVSVFFGISCSQEVETEVDKTAPKEVTNFTVTVKDNVFYLSWINPDDADFAGIQISMNPAEGILSNPISLGKTVTAFPISGLTVGKDYAFTVKTFDTSLNYSVGETVVKRIQSKDDPVNPDNPIDPDNPNDPVDPDKPNDPVDTTPPASVINLSAVYDAETLQITVSWKNPTDLDFAGTQLVYGKVSSADIKTLSFDKSYSQTVIQGIAADDSEYSFKIVAIDTAGNTSEVTSTTVIAKNEAVVLPSDLRTGDYVLTDNTYVRKEYFSELTQEERAKIFGIVCITDSGEALILGTQFSTNESRWTASPIGVDTYLADIATGVSGHAYYGYTFAGDLDGSDNWEYISSIDVVNATGAQVASMYPAFYLANIYASYAGLTGTDFAEGWYVPTISELYQMYKNIDVIKSSLSKLGINLPYTYDDNLNDYTCRAFWSSSVPTAPGQTAYKLDYYTGEIENVDRGIYSNYVWAFHKFDKKFDSYAYPEAQILIVELPSKVGAGYEGLIPVDIIGNNFYAYEITGDVYDVTYFSNTYASGYVPNPGYAGSHNITVTCGNATGVGILNVVDVDYSVGDILFTDGTKIKAENVQYGIPADMIPKAFGVVVGAKKYGATPFVVGIKKGARFQWAPSGTTGYNKNFTGIQGTITSGDTDGSDNWEYICSKDPEGTQDAETNYPAFNYANTYGQTAGLTGTEYADGWYLPSIAELKEIYNNRHILAESLSAVGGADTLGGSSYWSSSQSSSDNYDAYLLDFSYGSVNYNGKYYYSNVLVVQALTSKQFNNYEIGYTGTIIKDVKIASAGEGYTGELLVTIIGANLKGQSITCSDSSFDNLTYQSNTVATATIDCDGVVGEKSISFYCGSSVVTQTAKVLSSSNCITSSDIGKIVLSDGSFVSKDSFNSSTMTPIAVVVGSKYNGGQAIAVGLQKGYAMWAPFNTTGSNTYFTGIQGTTTRGDLDGSDNWAYICNQDSQATVYPAINYPAFNYANNYGITAGLVDSDYAEGWYLPSIAELDAVYDNKSTIQNSLNVVGGFIIGTSSYWSSSQSSSNYSYSGACKLAFDDGYVYDVTYKDINDNVFVLQAFNAQ